MGLGSTGTTASPTGATSFSDSDGLGDDRGQRYAGHARGCNRRSKQRPELIERLGDRALRMSTAMTFALTADVGQLAETVNGRDVDMSGGVGLLRSPVFERRAGQDGAGHLAVVVDCRLEQVALTLRQCLRPSNTTWWHWSRRRHSCDAPRASAPMSSDGNLKSTHALVRSVVGERKTGSLE